MRVTGVPAARVGARRTRDVAPRSRADHNQLQIDFVAWASAPGDVLRYQYRLEGADDDWSAPSDQRTVTYASLAPGRYRFLVRAVNSDGVVSADPRPSPSRSCVRSGSAGGS